MVLEPGARFSRSFNLLNDAFQRKQQAIGQKEYAHKCIERFNSNRGRARSREKKGVFPVFLDKQRIIQLAGVPKRHRNNASVEVEPDGAINIIFGGLRRPCGPKHGHYVINKHGIMIYRRERGKPHGPHNYLAVGIPVLT